LGLGLLDRGPGNRFIWFPSARSEQFQIGRRLFALMDGLFILPLEDVVLFGAD
jgi:hypothetical protein